MANECIVPRTLTEQVAPKSSAPLALSRRSSGWVGDAGSGVTGVVGLVSDSPHNGHENLISDMARPLPKGCYSARPGLRNERPPTPDNAQARATGNARRPYIPEMERKNVFDNAIIYCLGDPARCWHPPQDEGPCKVLACPPKAQCGLEIAKNSLPACLLFN